MHCSLLLLAAGTCTREWSVATAAGSRVAHLCASIVHVKGMDALLHMQLIQQVLASNHSSALRSHTLSIPLCCKARCLLVQRQGVAPWLLLPESAALPLNMREGLPVPPCKGLPVPPCCQSFLFFTKHMHYFVS